MKSVRTIFVIGLIIFWSPLAFAGEGHDAGYKWAEENGISDESNCYDKSGGAINNSESFTEGCLEYVQENAEEKDE